MVTDRFKLIRRAGGAEELYDFAADPGELTDVAAAHGEELAALHRTLGDALRRRAAAPSDRVNEESVPSDQHLEELRSWGTSTTEAPRPRVPLRRWRRGSFRSRALCSGCSWPGRPRR